MLSRLALTAREQRDTPLRQVTPAALRSDDPTGIRRLVTDEDQFRLLVAAVEDHAIISLDASGRVTGWNIGAQRIKGYEALTERWRVDAGLRYDALNTRSAPDSGDVVGATHGVISPKLGTLVRLSPQLSGYGNMSRGFRSVNGVITDPTLVPITAWAYETGVKFEHEGASASLALFRMDVSNEQTLNPVTLQSTSGGASRRQGVEIGWQVSISPQIAASGSWTFNDARYHSVVAAPTEGGGAPRTLDGLHVYNTASYIGAAALDITPGETRLRFRVSGNWVGAYSPFDEPGVLAGGYGLLHLTAVVPMDRFDVETGVRNLLDRAYPELIAGHIVSPGAPRTLLLSLRAHF